MLFDYNYQDRMKIDKYNVPLFYDIKMWNGLRTMSRIIKNCVDKDIDMVNVYAHVGKKALTELAKITKGTKTKLFALTVLTHYNDEYTMELYGKTVEQTIDMLSSWAEESGCQGIILPAKYLHVVKNKKLLKMCPGIRPDWYKNKYDNNQIQIDTPSNAVKNGADYIVIGSPIMKSDNPIEALKKILAEIDS